MTCFANNKDVNKKKWCYVNSVAFVERCGAATEGQGALADEGFLVEGDMQRML